MSTEARKDGPRALGRGLSALIGEDASPVRGEPPAPTRTLPIAFLKPNPLQPRKRFADDALADLAASIKEKGVLAPILVRPLKGSSQNFEIVAGERRWRAAQLAQLHNVPVVVRELSDSQALEIALIENVQRADLNAVEEAGGYHDLMERFGYTQEQLSREVGKSRSHVANMLRLLRLPESIKAMLRDGRLTAGHARTLLGAADPEARAREIIAGELNVREAEQRSGQRKRRLRGQTIPDPNVTDLESRISSRLGLKVKIMHKGDKGGEVRISYKKLEQLDDITQRLSKSG